MSKHLPFDQLKQWIKDQVDGRKQAAVEAAQSRLAHHRAVVKGQQALVRKLLPGLKYKSSVETAPHEHVWERWCLQHDFGRKPRVVVSLVFKSDAAALQLWRTVAQRRDVEDINVSSWELGDERRQQQFVRWVGCLCTVARLHDFPTETEFLAMEVAAS